MRRVLSLLLAIILAGCATGSPGGEGRASIPGDAQPYTVMAWRCGMQPWPQVDVLAIYSAKVLHHLRAEAGPVSESMEMEGGMAQLVLDDAERAGVLHRASLERDHPLVITHGETRRLDDEEVAELVQRAEAARGLSGNWTDSQVADGCASEHALWTGDSFAHVRVHDEAGPDELDALLRYERALHGL